MGMGVNMNVGAQPGFGQPGFGQPQMGMNMGVNTQSNQQGQPTGVGMDFMGIKMDVKMDPNMGNPNSGNGAFGF